MKKLFTFVLFATILCSSAFAEGDNNYYWFYDRAVVATTGKGLIYLSEESECAPEDYANECEFKTSTHGYSTTAIFYHAKPADGYEFVGLFPKANPTSMEERVSENNDLDAVINVTTMQVTENNDLEGYGFVPDTTFYAVFSKVYVKVANILERTGKVNIDKVINDKNDKVTITATPTMEGVEFDYWEDSEGNKITANPYTFTVGDDPNIYTAYFKGSKILTIDFGEGKYVPFSSAYEADFESGITKYIIKELPKEFYDENYNVISFDETQNAWGYTGNEGFVEYTGSIPDFTSNYQVAETYQAYVPNTGLVLYGEGVNTIVLYRETADDNFVGINTYLVGTATGAVNIESLPKQDDNNNNLVYYVFDTNAFVKATSGTVAENSCYLVLTEGVQYPLPEKIYMNAADDPTAITNVNAEKKIQFIGVYTIDGKKVEAPVKGINIVNGKKVLVK